MVRERDVTCESVSPSVCRPAGRRPAKRSRRPASKCCTAITQLSSFMFCTDLYVWCVIVHLCPMSKHRCRPKAGQALSGRRPASKRHCTAAFHKHQALCIAQFYHALLRFGVPCQRSIAAGRRPAKRCPAVGLSGRRPASKRCCTAAAQTSSFMCCTASFISCFIVCFCVACRRS